MRNLILAACLLFTSTAQARPVSDTYPHFYVLDESLTYRVQSEFGISEWFDEDEDIWIFSESFPTEEDLIRCELVRRIDTNF